MKFKQGRELKELKVEDDEDQQGDDDEDEVLPQLQGEADFLGFVFELGQRGLRSRSRT